MGEAFAQKDVVIRLLTEGDAKAFYEARLFALEDSPTAFGESAEHFRSLGIDGARQRLLEVFSTNGFIAGAFSTETSIVGLAACSLSKHEKISHKAMLWGMFVRPDFRSKHIGKGLIECVIEELKRFQHVTQINLATTSTNTPALALYQSLGFETFGREPRALRVEGSYHDEDLMILRLK